ncbi:hypothetical protein [Duganella qianjiadongensis]|uniref:Tetratricopeptide repeat protein n=1 Tax=Duganella qianjiadongensis TaxID=2692176 RepID=A0ABW9VMY4_9BURK|nr:hypothetical protein [Duganella qianjiadongensis]MYM40842.1 hypothetical protein [Duganella qianjiadongensis]
MKCASCQQPLFSAVAFCPYCRAPQAHGSADPVVPPAEVAPPVPRGKGETTRIPKRAETTPPRQPQKPPEPAKPAETKPEPVPAAKAAHAQPAAQPDSKASVAAGGQRKPSRLWRNLAIGIVLVLGLFAYMGQRDKARGLACQSAISAGQQALEHGDLDGARQQNDIAQANCDAPAKEQLAKFQKTLQAADTVETCRSNQRLLTTQLNEHKLESASKTLARLVPKCAAEANSGKLRRRLNQAQTSASNAVQATRRALASQNLAAAQQGMASLLAANTEAAEREELENEIVRLKTVTDARNEASVPAPAATTPAPAPVTSTAPANVPLAAPPAAAAPRPAPAADDSREQKSGAVASAKAEMAQTFITDAENALAQRRFDSARTYLESARRMDPANPRIEALSRQIRERERQLLQQDTTIR